VQPLICAVLVTQEQTPNVTPNAMVNVGRPLNAFKRQCPFDDHDDHDCHNNCDVTTCIQNYCPNAAEYVAAINDKLTGRQQELKANCCWPARCEFIQGLPFLLAHMPKSDCLCNCAHKRIRRNMDDHRECIPVLKEEE
jgi:hypothetical protein